MTCAVAQLLWEWKIEKPQWFNHTVSVAPDLDDMWGWRLKFERQHGTAAAQEEDVVVRCQAVEPRHTEAWQPIAKDNIKGGKSAKEILELVGTALQ